MSVRALDNEDADNIEDLREVQFVSAEGTELVPPVEATYAQFLHLVQAVLLANTSDKSLDSTVQVPVNTAANTESIQQLIQFFQTHYVQMNKLEQEDKDDGEEKKEKEAKQQQRFAWMLQDHDDALAVLLRKRDAATMSSDGKISDAVNIIHQELPQKKDPYFSYYYDSSPVSYDMEAHNGKVMPDVRYSLPQVLKDSSQATVGLTTLFSPQALCYLTKSALDNLDAVRAEYHATVMLSEADLRVEYGAECTADCRLRNAVDPNATPVCFLCRDWEVQDLPAAMQLLRTANYFGVHPDLQTTIEKKTVALLTNSLRNWAISWPGYSSTETANHTHLFRALGLSNVCLDTTIDNNHQATIYSDESAIPDLSDSSSATGAISQDLQMILAQKSVGRRTDFVTSILYVSLDFPKALMQSLLTRNASNVHSLCDLLENALLSGYAITGARPAQLRVIAEEPFKTTVLGLLRSIMMPLEGDLDDQEKIWLRLHHEYQSLLWSKCRDELIRVFGISPAHEQHFREAPTMRKFVAWFGAGADTDLEIVSVDEAAIPFQEETRSMDQIIRDQRAKHNEKVRQQEEQRLQRLRAERKRGSSNKSASPAKTFVVPAGPPAHRLLRGAGATSASSSSTPANAAQVQKARVRSLQQNVQSARAELASFDTYIASIGMDDIAVLSIAQQKRREKFNGLAILESALRLLHKKRDADMELVLKRSTLLRQWEVAYLVQCTKEKTKAT